MQFGRDKETGLLVSANLSILGKSYYCPYCDELLNSSTSKLGNVFFKHQNLHNRTPLQRCCPEYHAGNGYSKITGDSVIFIRNGGTPIYLEKNEDNFSCIAKFPLLSENTLNLLRNNNCTLTIQDNKYSFKNRITINHIINDISKKWVDVKLIPNVQNEEINKKYHYGFENVKINMDIFHSYQDGGFRLSRESNVYLNTNYRMIWSQEPPHIDGITLKKVGKISFKRMKYNVFDMIITKNNNLVKNFINSRNYNLCTEKEEILPIWPPAVIEGNQLIYTNDTAYFVKNNYNKSVKGITSNFSWNIGNTLSKIMKINPKYYYAIYTASKLNDEVDVNTIYWHIAYTNNFLLRSFPINLELKDINNQMLDFSNVFWNDNLKNLKFNTNLVGVYAVLKLGEYVLNYEQNSFTMQIDYHNCDIVCLGKGFGSKTLSIREKNIDLKDNNINWNNVYNYLYNCVGNNIPIDKRVLDWFYTIPSTQKELKTLISTWITCNSIPSMALKYIYKLL